MNYNHRMRAELARRELQNAYPSLSFGVVENRKDDQACLVRYSCPCTRPMVYVIGYETLEREEWLADFADAAKTDKFLCPHVEWGHPGLIDGLTPQQCLDSYTWWLQQSDAPLSATLLLTPRQLDAARSLWSAQIRAKQDEARERERRSVVVDDDRWEDE